MVSVPLREQRLLAQKSGNRCGFRDCRRALTADAGSLDPAVVIGDIAHIVADSPSGPRGNGVLSAKERNLYPNLILLCNQHHQLVDAQPQTYSVEVLRAMKEEHERWVETTLGPFDDLHQLKQFPVTETVHSTLLYPVHMPTYIYGVPCDARAEAEISSRLLPLRAREMAPFILRSGMLFAFQDMNVPGNPFGDLVF